jgi:hypothetical protein
MVFFKQPIGKVLCRDFLDAEREVEVAERECKRALAESIAKETPRLLDQYGCEMWRESFEDPLAYWLDHSRSYT